MGLIQLIKDLLYAVIVKSGIINRLMPLMQILAPKKMNTDKTYNYLGKDRGGKTLRLTKIDGRLYPPFPADNIKKVKQLNMRENDFFLVGYPKTGAHFVYEIMYMLVTGRRELSKFGKDLGGFIDPLPGIVLDSLPSPRILNSHLRYEQLPTEIKEKRTKIVLTVRNPKDTVVSYYNHHIQMKPNPYCYEGDFDDFFQLFLEGPIDYDLYFDYLKSWDDLVKNPPSCNPILMVSFEDMKLKPVETVKRIAEFLEVKVSDNDVDEIIKISSFDKMKAKRAGDITAGLYRKGKTGDWRNWLSQSQSDVIDQAWRDKMADCSYQPQY